jgi:hypothetical protein
MSYTCRFYFLTCDLPLPQLLLQPSEHMNLPVQTTVTSYDTDLSPCHGIKERPSRRLPSILAKPGGSLLLGSQQIEGTPDMSFSVRCLIILLGTRLLTNACLPYLAMDDQLCGKQICKPSRKPTATRTASSSGLSLQLNTGIACSQLP